MIRVHPDHASTKRYCVSGIQKPSNCKEVPYFGDTEIEQLQRDSVFRGYGNRATAKRFRISGIWKSSNCKEVPSFRYPEIAQPQRGSVLSGFYNVCIISGLVSFCNKNFINNALPS
jgi:hypothetical protein